ncbi:MAG: N-acetyltransferase [Pseudomonadota bacterium]
MNIREEQPGDEAAIRAMVTASFDRPDEATLIDRLRAECPGFVSVVAEDGGEIVGHVGFSPVTIGGNADHPVMGIAPLAIAPDRQRQGVGTALVRQGLIRCRDRGVEGVIVLGSPDYWGRFGFSPAIELGLETDFDVPPDAFQALEIKNGALLCIEGVVHYQSAFYDT